MTGEMEPRSVVNDIRAGTGVSNQTRFLFWNIRKAEILDLVCALVDQYDVDILVLAESKIPEETVLQSLALTQGQDYFSARGYSPSLQIYSRFLPRFLKPIQGSGPIQIHHLNRPLGEDVLLAAIHLPSKLYQSDTDQSSLCCRWVGAIQQAEARVGHSRTVVVGDFNMNPFESGVVGSEGFHAVMDERIARRGSRQVLGQERAFFYNPMWHYFRNTRSGPLGTYFYDRSGRPVNYYWNTFDQVLVRPDLIDRFSTEDLLVITAAGDTALLDASGRPDKEIASDHLPIFFTLTIWEVCRR